MKVSWALRFNNLFEVIWVDTFKPDASVLKAEGLEKVYGSRKVVKGVDLEVRSKEIVGLLGPNGAGKTTTFYMIVGLVKPTAGKVLIDGNDITREPVFKRAKAGISYLPQESSAFRRLTVEDNLRLVLEFQEYPEEEKEKLLEELLEEFGLSKLRRNMAYTLSGGERRKVEIARALTLKPKFLLLDEPFSGIDPITIDQIQELIDRLRRRRNIGIIITDHNVYETLEITDRSYIIADGKILVHGTPEEVAQNPLARKYYLGKDFKLLK